MSEWRTGGVTIVAVEVREIGTCSWCGLIYTTCSSDGGRTPRFLSTLWGWVTTNLENYRVGTPHHNLQDTTYPGFPLIASGMSIKENSKLS